MPTLADSVIGIAQDTNKQVASGGADALQAFHIAATAEHARQELDMEKDKQTMNKANWLTTQLDGISRMSPGVQKIALDSFQKQAGQVLGGSFNPDVVSAMKADEDLRKSSFAHASGVLSGGAIKTPEDATAILNLYGGSVQDATAGITTLGQHHMAMLGQQAKAEAIKTTSGAKNETFQVKNALQANAQYDKDIKPIDDTILNANRVHSIIAQIKAGGLKSTPTLTTDLSMALGSMFNKGNAATVAGTEHAGEALRSLQGAAASKYGWAEGKAMNTVAPEQLDQLDKDVQAARGEYVKARGDTFNSWIEGIPPQLHGPLKGRFMKFGSGAAAPPDEPRVNVVSPDGKVGHIPQSQLKEALASGYKEAK